MLTSDHAPMLGTLTPDRFGDTSARWMRPRSSAHKRCQVRSARLAERQMVLADLADLAREDDFLPVVDLDIAAVRDVSADPTSRDVDLGYGVYFEGCWVMV